MIKRLVSALCAVSMIFVLLCGAAGQTVYTPKVFMYHLIEEEPFSQYESLFVRPADFEAQIIFMKEKNYNFLFAEEYAKTATPSVILTFDDGYEDNYTEMFPILQKHQVKATIFVVSDYIGHPGYLNDEQLREMSESGLVSIQSHTKSHKDLTKISEADIRTEFRYSKYMIGRITGRPVSAVSFPEGQYTDRILKISGEYFGRSYGTRPRPAAKGVSNRAIPRQSVRRDLDWETFTQML